MRSTFKLLYFVKRNAVKKNGNAPIIARITIDQVIAQFNTKLEINPAHWSVELGKASGRTAAFYNLSVIRFALYNTLQFLQSVSQIDFQQFVSNNFSHFKIISG